MITSDQINELATALSAAQAAMQNATTNSINPHFRSQYADLAAIRDATIPILAKHGLAIMQATVIDPEGNLILHTRLAHKSGQWVESAYPLPVVLDKPQAMGSAYTYAKRYSWAALCGIAAESDDDANAAQGASNNSALKANPTKGLKNARQVRMSETYPMFEKEIRACPSLADLRTLWLNWQDEIRSWPAQHRELAEEEKDRRKLQLADELPIVEKLEESLQDD